MPENASFRQQEPGPLPPATGGASKGGVLSRIFEQHQGKWLIGLGAVTLIVMVIYLRKQNQQAVANVTGNSPTSGYGQGQTSPDQMWGAQLDADYQQMISNQNTTNGLLQQIMNQFSNPSGNPPGGTPQQPPATPSPTTPYVPIFSNQAIQSTPGSRPLVPYGTTIPSQLGDAFDYEGIHYTIDPGAGGRIWGVPGSYTKQQLQKGVGGTGILLMAPQSYYH